MFKNLTPHEVVIINGDEETRIPASGVVARVTEESEDMGTLRFQGMDYQIPVVRTRLTGVINLPEPDGSVFIVSMPVAQVVCRTDVMSPDTGPDSVIRDEGGRIIGVKRLRYFYREPVLTPYEQSDAVVDRIRERYGK